MQPEVLKMKNGELRNPDGFTLLELMISITLIAVIVLIAAGATRIAYRSVDSGERKIEFLERMRTSMNIIDSQIQSEVPLTYVDNAVTKYYFRGEKGSMQLSSNYSVWGGQTGYVVVAYNVYSNDRGGQDLYVSENIIGMESKRETKLLDSLNGIYFEYFYKDPTEEQGNWVEQWTDENNIPEKVRVHLVMGGSDFSMIIPMRSKNPAVQVSGQPQSSQTTKRTQAAGAGRL